MVLVLLSAEAMGSGSSIGVPSVVTRRPAARERMTIFYLPHTSALVAFASGVGLTRYTNSGMSQPKRAATIRELMCAMMSTPEPHFDSCNGVKNMVT